jgi:hypothetical protein
MLHAPTKVAFPAQSEHEGEFATRGIPDRFAGNANSEYAGTDRFESSECVAVLMA